MSELSEQIAQRQDATRLLDDPTEHARQMADALVLVVKHQQKRIRAYDRPGWHPIETAPKDGHRLLLAGTNAGVPWVSIGHWAPYEGNVWNADERKPLQGVTDWQPLPAPPSPRS